MTGPFYFSFPSKCASFDKDRFSLSKDCFESTLLLRQPYPFAGSEVFWYPGGNSCSLSRPFSFARDSLGHLRPGRNIPFPPHYFIRHSSFPDAHSETHPVLQTRARLQGLRHFPVRGERSGAKDSRRRSLHHGRSGADFRHDGGIHSLHHQR